MNREEHLTRLDPDELTDRAEALAQLLSPCTLCPRRCRVDRTAGELGECGIGEMPRISSSGLHFGEESVLVGGRGSGTIFLAGCNLSCIFCQNYDISHLRHGETITSRDLARIMLRLQDEGAANINGVTPTHVIPWLIDALAHARRDGLTVPIVYNCGGYESTEVLGMLRGAIDIYLPDAKFAESLVAGHLAGAADYFSVACRAITEMYNQVGDIRLDTHGLAYQGVLVRHLVLPESLSGSDAWAKALHEIFGNCSSVNIMDQYRPAFQATRHPGLGRRITQREYAAACDAFLKSGLNPLEKSR